MNKSRHQFATLSQQDRTHILELCSKHHYDEVVDRVARPRSEGGLGIATSKSALCRFFTTSHIEPGYAVLSQTAAAVNIRHEQDANAFLGAIRASVEARVLQNLMAGKALVDLEKDFRLLKTAENLYLADAKWRAENPKAARAAYQALVDRSAKSPDIDFVPIEELKSQESDALGVHPSGCPSLIEPSDFDRDVIQTRERQKREAEQRQQLLAKLQTSGSGPQETSVPSTPAPSKTPAIPQIPPNPTSDQSDRHKPAVLAKTPSAPPSNPPADQPQQPVRVPFVRATPKIDRNAPCPCGSGKKHKHCCLQNLNPTAPKIAA